MTFGTMSTQNLVEHLIFLFVTRKWMAQWQMLAIHRPVLVQVCPDIDIEGAAYVIVSCSSIKMTVRSL